MTESSAEVLPPQENSGDTLKAQEVVDPSASHVAISSILTVRKLVHRRVQVEVMDGRVFLGKLHCLDKQGNLILFDTQEFVPQRMFPLTEGEQGLGPKEEPQESDTDGRIQESLTVDASQPGLSTSNGGDDSLTALSIPDTSALPSTSSDNATGSSSAFAILLPSVPGNPPGTSNSAVGTSRDSLLEPSSRTCRTSSDSTSSHPAPGASVQMKEQRRLGLVLIPKHVRVSCQLESPLEEELSFLKI